LFGVSVLGGVLRFSELGSQSYWFDESVTAGLLDSSLSDVFSSLSESESTPPLYYVMAWVWTQVFGAGEAGLRSLSALAGVGVIPLVWACGRELLSSRAGLAAAALVAINPMLIWYSQEARAYSLLTLLVAASFWFFLRARRAPTINWLLAWAVASALAVATTTSRSSSCFRRQPGCCGSCALSDALSSRPAGSSGTRVFMQACSPTCSSGRPRMRERGNGFCRRRRPFAGSDRLLKRFRTPPGFSLASGRQPAARMTSPETHPLV